MVRVSVFLDVEDPINPQADDAALDLAKLITAAGVRASFCVTGEKCRKLHERGRMDVAEALKQHCLGLHTDTHSQHPTTMELLAELDYDEGVVAAAQAEAKGYRAFEALFGRPPVFWGGAGNTWSPEISDALRYLDVPAYVYALTEVPGGVHQFNGVMAFPQDVWISETEWVDDEKARLGVQRVHRYLAESERPWVGLFVGHPTKFRYKEFWDKPYMGGETPQVPAGVPANTDEEYERSLANLAAFLKGLCEHADVVGMDEAVSMPWQFRSLTEGEVAEFRKRTAQNLMGAVHWPIHRPDLNVAKIVQKTLDKTHTVRAAVL